jgi:hypothetical protein
VTPYEPPPAFLKARKKHRLPDPSRTAGAIWDALQMWQKIPLFRKLEGESDFLYRLRVYQTEKFEAELIYAIKSDDHEFNEQLTKARESGEQPPRVRITAAQAGVEAFSLLFDPEQIETIRANWPTKNDVIQTATFILKEAGQSGYSKRHWSRVLAEIGLKNLPESPERRPRKLVT